MHISWFYWSSWSSSGLFQVFSLCLKHEWQLRTLVLLFYIAQDTFTQCFICFSNFLWIILNSKLPQPLITISKAKYSICMPVKYHGYLTISLKLLALMSLYVPFLCTKMLDWHPSLSSEHCTRPSIQTKGYFLFVNLKNVRACNEIN